MIDWLKIKQTGFSRSAWIGIYKILYRTVLWKEKLRLAFTSGSFRTDTGLPSGCLPGRDTTDYTNFIGYCRFDRETIRQADAIGYGRIELFGQTCSVGNNWLSDPVTGQKIDPDVFFADASTLIHPDTDVKFLMELNKLYHPVVLACAYYDTKEEKYLHQIEACLRSWTETVRYERSIVNKIIMDLAYRNLNLIYIYVLGKENAYFRAKIYPYILRIVYLQTKTIRKFATPKWFKTGNESNHTIGEMAGLIVSELWLSKQIKGYRPDTDRAIGYLNRTLDKLLTSNGVYLEQSFNYTKIVLDFLFVLDVFIRDFGIRPRGYTSLYLTRIQSYFSLLTGDDFSPNFGDNDSSRVVLPFYYSNRYLNACTGKESGSSLFDPESGQIVWNSAGPEKIRLFTRCGAFSVYKLGAAVHCHSDLLALLLSVKGEKIFVDRGTSYYNRSIGFRNRDRSSAVHNCLSVAGIEQAEPHGKWSYKSYPAARIDRIDLSDEKFHFAGQVRYQGYTIRREIDYPGGNELEIRDTIDPLPSGHIILNYLLNPALSVEATGDRSLRIGLASGACLSVTFSIPVKLEETELFETYSKSVKTRRIYSCLPGTEAVYPIKTTIKILP